MDARVPAVSDTNDSGTAGRDGAMARPPVPMEVVALTGRPLRGALVSRRVGHLRLASVEAEDARFLRTPALISRGPATEPYVGVGLQLSGRAVLEQGGRRTEAGPGSLVLYDTARPFSLVYPEPFRSHLLHLPRHLLGVPERDVRQVAGTALAATQWQSAIVAPFLDLLAATASTCAVPAGDRWADIVADLVSGLVTEAAAAGRLGERDQANDDLMLRVRTYIDRHLGEPELTPERIAAAHRISLRYLHRLFEAEGEGVTVRRLIQHRRLQECARELGRRGRVVPTVSAVAHRWGFANPAHFSRAFRAAYGISPSQWRGTGHQDPGGPVPPTAAGGRAS
ncbi:helix-turn-helix domain-containing protein [Streptomyces sp. NPDC048717]|uniref:AraC-like ligand-binding domain-containing protein n=1 Tax=unclassified Streptomyces TaxID=2593676 RepID=UPI00342E718D